MINHSYPLVLVSIKNVVFKLQGVWDQKSFSVFDKLLKTVYLNAGRNELKLYKISLGCVQITLIAHEQISDYLISTSKQKSVFMKLVGIFSLKISHTIVYDDDENKSFAFDESFLEASLIGNLDALKFLISIGVNIDYQNMESKTALMIASKHGHKEIVNCLLLAKANVNNVNNTAQPALLLASENNDIAIVQLLLEAKANPNHQRDDGNTSLHIACYREYNRFLIIPSLSFLLNPLILYLFI